MMINLLEVAFNILQQNIMYILELLGALQENQTNYGSYQGASHGKNLWSIVLDCLNGVDVCL